MKQKIMIWFESSHGTGHGSVVSQLCQSLLDEQLQPVLLCSEKTQKNCKNFNWQGVEFSLLPSKPQSKNDYLRWRQELTNGMQKALRETAPAAVITEIYPFSRGFFDFALVPFIEQAHQMRPRPLIYSLMRDIGLMNDSMAKGESGFADFVNKYYDRIFIRGDKNILALDETFPMLSSLEQDKLDYAGYFVNKMPPRTTPIEHGKVLVATGGAWLDAYLPIYESAIAAKDNTQFLDRQWVFYISDKCPNDVFDKITEKAKAKNITVQRNNPQYRVELANAALSISACGYNTIMEVVSAGVPAVVIPLVDRKEGQCEQVLRAEIYQKRQQCKSVPSDCLNADSLATAIRIASDMKPISQPMQMGGAAVMAQHIAVDVRLKTLNYYANTGVAGNIGLRV